MAIQVVINQAGPLPIKAAFNSLGDEPVYLEVNGSVWTKSDNEMMGIAIQLDGQSIGTAQIFSNGNGTHRTVVPAYSQIQLSEGQHTLILTTNSGSLSDSNDFYTAVIHY